MLRFVCQVNTLELIGSPAARPRVRQPSSPGRALASPGPSYQNTRPGDPAVLTCNHFESNSNLLKMMTKI